MMDHLKGMTNSRIFRQANVALSAMLNGCKDENTGISKLTKKHEANLSAIYIKAYLRDNGNGNLIAETAVRFEVVGKMSESNNKMAVGSLNIYSTFGDKGEILVDKFSMKSGPSGVGALPNASYTANGITEWGWKEEGMVRDGAGFKVLLIDIADYCRTEIRIHPDGEDYEGTSGCIGLQGNKTILRRFYDAASSALQQYSTINVLMNIEQNPQYSDCNKDGKKKGKKGPAGN